MRRVRIVLLLLMAVFATLAPPEWQRYGRPRRPAACQRLRRDRHSPRSTAPGTVVERAAG